VRFSRKRQDGSAPNYFSGLGENTCSLQLALKNTAPAFKLWFTKIFKINFTWRGFPD